LYIAVPAILSGHQERRKVDFLNAFFGLFLRKNLYPIEKAGDKDDSRGSELRRPTRNFEAVLNPLNERVPVRNN
jgi:hypothetical protein